MFSVNPSPSFFPALMILPHGESWCASEKNGRWIATTYERRMPEFSALWDGSVLASCA